MTGCKQSITLVGNGFGFASCTCMNISDGEMKLLNWVVLFEFRQLYLNLKHPRMQAAVQGKLDRHVYILKFQLTENSILAVGQEEEEVFSRSHFMKMKRFCPDYFADPDQFLIFHDLTEKTGLSGF